MFFNFETWTAAKEWRSKPEMENIIIWMKMCLSMAKKLSLLFLFVLYQNLQSTFKAINCTHD
jgi:hypothetical protein